MDRFWEKVDRRGPADCWPWIGATNEDGYGIFRSGEGVVRAHRMSAALAGISVAGVIVRHSCDNPPCVNPAHLLVGTQADNVADMIKRGRGNRGLVNGMAHHPDDLVAAARGRVAAGERQRDVATDLGVSPSTLSHWIHNHTRPAPVYDERP